MARPRSAVFDGQRELILSAAAQHFAQRGYGGSTMTEVAAACGISKGTLYHYVRDKQDLLAQIATTHVQRLQDLVRALSAQHLPPRQQLTELVLRFMQVYERAQADHRVLTEDMKFLPDGGMDSPRQRVLQGQREVVQAVADAVAALRPELQAAGLHKPVAMLLFGMLNWTYTWLHDEGPLSHDDVARLVLGVFLGGIQTVQLQQSTA